MNNSEQPVKSAEEDGSFEEIENAFQTDGIMDVFMGHEQHDKAFNSLPRHYHLLNFKAGYQFAAQQFKPPPLPEDIEQFIKDEAERRYSLLDEAECPDKEARYAFNQGLSATKNGFEKGAKAVANLLSPQLQENAETIKRLQDGFNELVLEKETLLQALHRDETGLAKSLADTQKILDSYHWLTEGRGPYAWNDDRYKGEVLTMLEKIGGVVKKGLSESGKRSHAYCCSKGLTYEQLRDQLQETEQEIARLRVELADSKSTRLLEGEAFANAYEEIQKLIGLLENEVKGRAFSEWQDTEPGASDSETLHTHEDKEWKDFCQQHNVSPNKEETS